MKTRKKIYSGLLMAAAALLCLAGCKKDEEGEKIMLGTQFEKAVSAQKTYLGENNTVCWSAGDEVKVNGTVYSVSAEGIEVDAADNYYAVYPAEGNSVDENGGMVTLPASQTYTLENGKQVLNGPMAAHLDASSGILYFKNLYSLLKVTVSADDKAFTVSSITVTATGDNARALAGSYTFTFNGATTEDLNTAPIIGNIASGSSKVTLKYIATEVSAGEDKDFYLAVHPFAAQNLTVKVSGMLDGNPVAYTHTTATTVGLSRSRIGGLGINLQQLQPKELGFSVAAGRTVEFAPGNLQYQGSTGSWCFAEHQWNIIGNAAGNTTTSANRANQSAWIDLFGWGTSGYNSKYPYMTSQTNTDYGDGTNDIAGSDYDWGKYNDIYNPKTKSTDDKGTWRTPSNGEWKYLLNIDGNSGRTDANRFAMVKVNNVNGLLIFPDGYTLLSGYTADGGAGMAKVNDRNATMPTESIPNSTWIVMEAMGCVFLPAAGYRSYESVFGVSTDVIYWSSTKGSTEEKAYRLNFQAENKDGHYNGSRKYGVSVRLVKDIE